MRVTLTTADLQAFEQHIAECFLDRQIRAPIHLQGGGGCEENLIRIFRERISPDDWVLVNWRSHLKCLLKGVPARELKAEILAGRSISLCFPQYRVLGSGIVGGTSPIGVGLAMGIKRKGEENKRRVFVFVGDMEFHAGVVGESIKYAVGHNLPITWVVESNGLSVNTKTISAWGTDMHMPQLHNVIRYNYTNKWPHVGCGRFVEF